MIRKEIVDRLKEVYQLKFRFHSDEAAKACQAVDEDPEACLISLLESIKRDLPSVSSVTSHTVERAAYESHIKKAKQILRVA